MYGAPHVRTGGRSIGGPRTAGGGAAQPQQQLQKQRRLAVAGASAAHLSPPALLRPGGGGPRRAPSTSSSSTGRGRPTISPHAPQRATVRVVPAAAAPCLLYWMGGGPVLPEAGALLLQGLQLLLLHQGAAPLPLLHRALLAGAGHTVNDHQ